MLWNMILQQTTTMEKQTRNRLRKRQHQYKYIAHICGQQKPNFHSDVNWNYITKIHWWSFFLVLQFVKCHAVQNGDAYAWVSGEVCFQYEGHKRQKPKIATLKCVRQKYTKGIKTLAKQNSSFFQIVWKKSHVNKNYVDHGLVFELNISTIIMMILWKVNRIYVDNSTGLIPSSVLIRG